MSVLFLLEVYPFPFKKYSLSTSNEIQHNQKGLSVGNYKKKDDKPYFQRGKYFAHLFSYFKAVYRPIEALSWEKRCYNIYDQQWLGEPVHMHSLARV